MRSESIKITVNKKEYELQIGDDIWFVTKEDFEDTVKGGIIEKFYNNSFKLIDKNHYFNCSYITDIGYMDRE